MITNLKSIPVRDWNKELMSRTLYKGKTLKIYTVEPQAHLVATTQAVGNLEGYSAESVLTLAFSKNYKTASNPKVVANYGFEQKHGEPIEMIDYVYECIFDRACEAEINRYRHNSKNYESGRYVDYLKHGITVVVPPSLDKDERHWFIHNTVRNALVEYTDLILNGHKKQDARRVFGTYLAVESVIKVNLRSLWHMATQRSARYSPNGREAEPQISSVVTQMVEGALPHLPVFWNDLLKQIGKGYR